MRALVTGGSGFIGSHLVRRLLSLGHDVAVLDRSVAGKGLDAATLARVRVTEGDACDAAMVEAAAAGCDCIFHFAALVGVEHYSANPVGTMQVEERSLAAACAAALAIGCRKLVYPSSSAVYGDVEGLLEEDRIVAPTSPYAVAKRFGEMFLASQYQQNRLQSVALRIFNVYGPGQDERLVIPRFVRRGLAGEPLVLFGDGSQRRDFPYIDDVVSATVLAAERIDGCEVVNIASGVSHSIREVAETAARLTGGRSPIQLQPLPPGREHFEVRESRGATAKLLRLTGFRPATSLAEGLAATVQSFSA